MNLLELLHEFNKLGYSDPNAKYVENGKNGKILRIEKEQYVYEDEFYGGEPYSGNETIWENGRPLFRCVYYGQVEDGIDFGKMYGFLQKALAAGLDQNIVHRGPKNYSEGNLTYKNSCNGTVEDFLLTETISMDGKGVYMAMFRGGLVDRKR